MENKEKNGSVPTVVISDEKENAKQHGDVHHGSFNNLADEKEQKDKTVTEMKSWRRWCRIEPFTVLFYLSTSAISIIYPQLLYDMVSLFSKKDISLHLK